MDKEIAVKIISALKRKQFTNVYIHSSHNATNYVLQLLTDDTLLRDDIISLLSRWRKKHEQWFPNQFAISDERTRTWLKTRVQDVGDRLLFLLSVKAIPIGHVGLFRFDWEHNCCEIDNIVRGEDGYPGIMQHAVGSMMQWGRETFGITTYALQTTSDNAKALALYSRLGFRETKRVPLVYIKNDEGGEWVEAPKGYKGDIQRYVVHMRST